MISLFGPRQATSRRSAGWSRPRRRWRTPSRWGVLRDRGLAEDAAQEAYLRAFRRLGDLDEPAGVRQLASAHRHHRRAEHATSAARHAAAARRRAGSPGARRGGNELVRIAAAAACGGAADADQRRAPAVRPALPRRLEHRPTGAGRRRGRTGHAETTATHSRQVAQGDGSGRTASHSSRGDPARLSRRRSSSCSRGRS